MPNAICKKIITDAEADAIQILENANAKKEQILSKAQSDAKLLGANIISKAKSERDAIKQKLISNENMSAKKDILSAKQTLIDAVIKKAIYDICNMSDHDYKKCFVKLLQKAYSEISPDTKQLNLYMSERDLKRIPKKEIINALDGCKVNLFEENIPAGFIIKSKNVDLNFTPEFLAYQENSVLLKIISQILF